MTHADNQLAPDGYRYGVMFNDGSVAERWNGRTQRERAQEYAAAVVARQIAYIAERQLDWQHDNITLARRLPNGRWERVS